MVNQFGSRIKKLREDREMLQRQVAALLDMDTPLYSKIERGERTASKTVALKLAEILNANQKELLTLWLADQVFEVVKDESVANEALKSVSQKIKVKK
jgi:HTH-type transcriptional regulator, competence development regulator